MKLYRVSGGHFGSSERLQLPISEGIAKGSRQRIIHGTLRDEDLLDAFAATLEDCITKNPELWVEHRQNLTALVWDAREAAVGSEMSGELINDLIDALQEFAPPGHTFGAHEGDGADFGFWSTCEDCSSSDEESP